MKSVTKVKHKLIFVAVLLLVPVSFLVGFYWHTILLHVNAVNLTTLRCFGLNNFKETYQVDCFSPISSKQKDFKFKKNLDCKVLINTQFANGGETLEIRKNTFNPKYNDYFNLMLIKSDYRNFTLDFTQLDSITSSFEPGEPDKDPYTINLEDERMIHATRKVPLEDFFGDIYEYITISKDSGKGMKTWVNTNSSEPTNDVLVSEFFQCE